MTEEVFKVNSAQGYFELAVRDASIEAAGGREPYNESPGVWCWRRDHNFPLIIAPILRATLPWGVFDRLGGGRLTSLGQYREYPTRLAAVDALVAALEAEYV
jgi:hypothetical protein